MARQPTARQRAVGWGMVKPRKSRSHPKAPKSPAKARTKSVVAASQKQKAAAKAQGKASAKARVKSVMAASARQKAGGSGSASGGGGGRRGKQARDSHGRFA